MIKVDRKTLDQVREAMAKLESYDLTVPSNRSVHAAIDALRAAKHRLANPLSQHSTTAAAAAVEGLREASGLSPRRDEPPREMPRPVLPDEPPPGPGLPRRRLR